MLFKWQHAHLVINICPHLLEPRLERQFCFTMTGSLAPFTRHTIGSRNQSPTLPCHLSWQPNPHRLGESSPIVSWDGFDEGRQDMGVWPSTYELRHSNFVSSTTYSSHEQKQRRWGSLFNQVCKWNFHGKI